MSKFLLFFICLYLSVSATAQDINTFSQSRSWNKLLHKPDAYSRSTITNDSFFLSEHGHFDGLAELRATIEAFKRPVEIDTIDSHPICRFPARYLLLRQQNLIESLPIYSCKEYQFWKGDSAQQRINVIFADGYMGNPASFYGHLLLKVDSSDPKYTTDLLSNSLNFGADVPDDENPIVYILKGIVGGYQAQFNSNFSIATT